MSSLYKNNGTYYLSVNVDGKRKAKSLKTKNKDIAKTVRAQIELQMQKELRSWSNGWNKLWDKGLPSDWFIQSSLVSGEVGELYTDADLLKRGFSTAKSRLDDSGVDRIVEIRDGNKSRFITLQIKYSQQYDSSNSIRFDVKRSRADWVAFVTEIQHSNGLISPIVMYMKNKRINKRWTTNIQVGDHNKNGQKKLVNHWTDFINPKF